MEKNSAYAAWRPELLKVASKDVRLECVKYARLAANTHNIQPWRIKLIGKNEVLLFIDSTRLVEQTDPDLKGIFITQGTFLQTFKIAASHYKYECIFELFPNGIPTQENPGSLPIAKIVLTFRDDMIESPLFKFITLRNSNHGIYSKKEIDTNSKKLLLESNFLKTQGYDLLIFDSSEKRKKISELMVQAMYVQTNTESTLNETIHMMRFRDKEVEEKRDGFAFENLGLKGVKLFLAKNLATPQLARSKFFRNNMVTALKTLSDSAMAFGVIYALDDNRETQVKTGLIFANVHLTATKLGIAFSPMDHILAKYKEVGPIEQQFNKTVQNKSKKTMAVFRMGYSDYYKHTPRRVLDDLIINDNSNNNMNKI